MRDEWRRIVCTACVARDSERIALQGFGLELLWWIGVTVAFNTGGQNGRESTSENI